MRRQGAENDERRDPADWDALKPDVEPIYTAVNADAARAALDELAQKRGGRYGGVIRLWENAWTEFTPFLDYDVEIRKVICSTTAIESLNARCRRAVRWKPAPNAFAITFAMTRCGAHAADGMIEAVGSHPADDGRGRDRGGVVPRPSLFGRLGSSARVTVVSAPAGSGKTVLPRSWIDGAGLAGRAAVAGDR